MAHRSVLVKEVLEGLSLKENDVVVDGTINGGGHSLEIVKYLGKKGILVGIDQDASALEISGELLKAVSPRIHLVHNNTRNLKTILKQLEISHIDKILLDLGWSSNQFENPDRGFSFLLDGPLTMTLSEEGKFSQFTAEDMVNDWAEQSLVDVIEGYGEERYARMIVKAIIEKRLEKRITRTLELAEIIKNAVPLKYQHGPTHPATKTFQALRIAVNDEMQALSEILEQSFEVLSPLGRVVVISFHSIEDRIVKNFFKQKKEKGEAILINKKPIIASEEELFINRRSRSAKLRILQKI